MSALKVRLGHGFRDRGLDGGRRGDGGVRLNAKVVVSVAYTQATK